MLLLGSRPTFIFGHEYPHGEPFYFPIVFVLKSPLGFLGLLLVALALWIALRRRRDISLINVDAQPHWRVLMTTFWVFLAICLLSRLDISIRHFTMPMVLLIMMLAPLPRMLSYLRARRGFQGVTAVLVASCFVAVIAAYPHLFSFVNSLGRGHALYRLVNDSNVDWNQTLPEVQEYAEAHGMKDVKLDWVALSDPAHIIPNARPWDCQAAASGDRGQTVIVSAVAILEIRNCGWLEQYPHEAIANGGMYAFHLPDPIPDAGTPGGPPLPAKRKAFFGVPFDMRGTAIELEQHPEKTSVVMQEIMRRFHAPQSGKSKK